MPLFAELLTLHCPTCGREAIVDRTPHDCQCGTTYSHTGKAIQHVELRPQSQRRAASGGSSCCGGGETKPQPPPMTERLWNLAGSLATFVADGLRTTDAECYDQRLRACDSCDQRNERLCVECGCYIDIKAKMRAMECPLDRWAVS